MSIWPPVAIVMIAVLLYLNELKGYNWKTLFTSSFWESVGFALFQGMIAQAVGIVIIIYGLGITQPSINMTLTPAILISAVVFSAVFEELLYRKIIYSKLNRYMKFWPAAVISSLLFAVSHYDYSAYIGNFLLGFVWCYAYRRSGNLGVVIAAHILFNTIAFAVMGLRG